MSFQSKRMLPCYAVMLLVASAGIAKRNDPNIELSFTPTEAVGGAEVDVSSLTGIPVQIRVEDARQAEDEDRIGVRTDDDDERHVLRATNDVADFVRESIIERARDWGLAVRSSADRILTFELISLSITETNQAVGATYRSEIRLGWSIGLEGVEGEATKGSAFGDATRWGKKFSSDNSNEVLSDALVEALAEALNSSALQEALSGND